MASSSTKLASRFLFSLSLLLLLLVSLTDARVLKICDFDTIYSFGEGQSSVSNGLMIWVQHVATAFNIPSTSQASFASPESTVMDKSFFVRNRIQPPSVKNSLESQVNNFVDLLGPKLTMTFEKRVNMLRRSVFFIDQAGVSDYKQAFSQGKSMIEVSKFVPEIVSKIKNQIRKLIFTGASNVLVSGIPPLGSSMHDSLNMFGLLHNDHLQQAIVELKLQFPEVIIVYADYYKMNEKGFSQSALEFAKAKRCNYFQIGEISYSRRKAHLEFTRRAIVY